MLFNEHFFTRFSRKRTNEATDTSEMVTPISADRPEKVEMLPEEAIFAGVSPSKPYDMGWVKGWGGTTPDKHTWEVLYIDRNKTSEDEETRAKDIDFHYEHRWY